MSQIFGFEAGQGGRIVSLAFSAAWMVGFNQLRQFRQPDVGAAGDRHGGFNDIAQLTNVSRPFITACRFQGLRRQAFETGTENGILLTDEMTDEQGNILRTFSEWRQMEIDDIESIEKVFAESPFGHRGLQIGVGR